MGEPLNKIQYDEKHQQLKPRRPGRSVDNGKAGGFDTYVAEEHFQKLVKSAYGDCKEEKVEEHIKGIQPEILAENGLFFSPGEQDFQPPDDQGYGD